MKPKAIYAGSFDPIHYGHLDIIERASKIFDLTVLVANNPAKKYALSLGERFMLVKSLAVGCKVDMLTGGLLADYAYHNGIKIIIKGVRTFQDYDYERLLHEITISQMKGIETFPMISKANYSHISSSACRELATLFANTKEYMPAVCKEAVEQSMYNMQLIGVTGYIGSGKSTLCRHILATQFAYTAYISTDVLAHRVLVNPPVPLMEWLMDNNINPTSPKLRSAIAEKIFKDTSLWTSYNRVIYPLIFVELKKELYKIAMERAGQRHVLIESAPIAGTDFASICNNRILYVDTPISLCCDRALARGNATAEDINSRMVFQQSYTAMTASYPEAKIIKVPHTLIPEDVNSEPKDQLLKLIEQVQS